MKIRNMPASPQIDLFLVPCCASHNITLFSLLSKIKKAQSRTVVTRNEQNVENNVQCNMKFSPSHTGTQTVQ
jgi:hypothetical protein